MIPVIYRWKQKKFSKCQSRIYEFHIDVTQKSVTKNSCYYEKVSNLKKKILVKIKSFTFQVIVK